MIPFVPTLIASFEVICALHSTASQITLLLFPCDTLFIHKGMPPMDLRIRLTAGLQIHFQANPDHLFLFQSAR